MSRRVLLVLALSTAFAGSSQAAQIGGGGPRYDGTVKITKLQGASCPASQEGDIFPAIFRAEGQFGQVPEALSIAIDQLAGGLFIVAKGGRGTLAGDNQSATGSYILDAWRSELPEATLNLNFNPNVIRAGTQSFTFRGTIKSYIFKGCTATVRGTFDKR